MLNFYKHFKFSSFMLFSHDPSLPCASGSENQVFNPKLFYDGQMQGCFKKFVVNGIKINFTTTKTFKPIHTGVLSF